MYVHVRLSSSKKKYKEEEEEKKLKLAYIRATLIAIILLIHQVNAFACFSLLK